MVSSDLARKPIFATGTLGTVSLATSMDALYGLYNGQNSIYEDSEDWGTEEKYHGSIDKPQVCK